MILRNIILYPLRFTVLTVHCLSLTRGCFVFALLVVLGFYCTTEHTLLQHFSRSVVLFAISSSFFLLIVLNITPFSIGERVQGFIGVHFLQRFLVGRAKGLLALLSLLVIASLLYLVEDISFTQRTTEYYASFSEILTLLYDVKQPDNCTLEEVAIFYDKIEVRIAEELKDGLPVNGFLTDFTNWVNTCVR